MRSIYRLEMKFPREALLQKLRENKEKHETRYKEAKDGYLTQLKECLESSLRNINEQGIYPSFDAAKEWFDKPRYYGDCYTQALEMLEFCSEESVTLSGEQFRELVNDEWNWSSDFDRSHAKYSSLSLHYGK